MAGLIGRKLGMTQIFDDAGAAVPVTIVEAGPCPVTQVKTTETDGYSAIQVGWGESKEKHSTKAERLSAVYQRLFGGKVQVPPYEGSYELDPIRQGRQMADIAAFYRAFGAEAHGPAAERPDHVGCELEFLAFLELRRLAAVEEGDETGAEIVDEITTTFLGDHAGRWLPTFLGDVSEAAAHSPVHRTLAVLGAGALEGELVRRGIEPAPLTRRHARLAVEADSLDCGTADSATGLLGR